MISIENYIGSVMMNFLISLLALNNVRAFFIVSGALFHTFAASLYNVDCILRLFPGTIRDSF